MQFMPPLPSSVMSSWLFGLWRFLFGGLLVLQLVSLASAFYKSGMYGLLSNKKKILAESKRRLAQAKMMDAFVGLLQERNILLWILHPQFHISKYCYKLKLLFLGLSVVLHVYLFIFTKGKLDWTIFNNMWRQNSASSSLPVALGYGIFSASTFI